MDYVTELALRRAGAGSLAEFQSREGIAETGELDARTREALAPYALGYQIVRVHRGDTFYHLAREYGTTEAAVAAANPRARPENLRVGSLLVVPFGFSLVPDDAPVTSGLLDVIIRGLIARYPFVRAEPIGFSRAGRRLWMLRAGRGARRALYNASHHANELITTSVTLKFFEQLCAACVAGGSIFGQDARGLLARTTLHFMPMVNPDGVDLVLGAATEAETAAAEKLAESYPDIPFPDGWKANLAGVDLNLQYPAGWEQARQIKFEQGYTRPGPRDFVGPAALSEPEPAALYAYTQAVQPDLTLSYHTQGRVIYWRFAGIEPPRGEQIGRKFSAVSGYALEDTPYASGFAGYKDYFIQEFDRPGYTIECGEGENPLPIAQLGEIYEHNLGILTLGLAEA